MLGKLALACALLAASAQAWSCEPVKVLMTRASGSSAVNKTLDDNSTVWEPYYALSSVDLANVKGGLKYVITETIDWETGVDHAACERKNWVKYIHFYLFEVCNTNQTLWWFSPNKEDGYGDFPQYDLKGYGQYLTMDGGLIHTVKERDLLWGTNGQPELGRWVGWSNESSDPRNPTDESYWYSAPGACGMRPWTPGYMGVEKGKDDECIEDYPSGEAPENETANGDPWTYTYTFLGQIDIDEMVGITAMGYTNYTEFCKAGNREFERNETDYNMTSGLDFWKDPLSREANAERVEKMLEHYNNKTLYPLNKPLPTPEELEEENPPCYCNLNWCTEQRRCKYDSSQFCVYCNKGEEGCDAPDYSKCKNGKPPALDEVELPEDEKTAKPTDSGDDSNDTESPDTDVEGDKTDSDIGGASSAAISLVSLALVVAAGVIAF